MQLLLYQKQDVLELISSRTEARRIALNNSLDFQQDYIGSVQLFLEEDQKIREQHNQDIIRLEEEGAQAFQGLSARNLSSVNELNERQLRAFINYGNAVGVYAKDLVEDLESSGSIDEEEAFRLTGIIEEQTKIVEEESDKLKRALASGFSVEVSPQLSAAANAVLTIGEGFVSVGAAAEGFLGLFTGSGPADALKFLLSAGEGLATFVSIGEQPFLAIQDAVIVASDEYKAFIKFLELSEEERNQLLDVLPDDLADRIRSVARDIEEVYARVGTGFDADLFRALPLQLQSILEDSFNRFREINPTLREIYEEAKKIVEEENITLAERIRRVTRFLTTQIGETPLQLFQSVANVAKFLTSNTDDLGRSFGILKEIAGGVGEILGVGRERTIAFVEGLDTFISSGESTLILQERITQSLGLSTIGIALGFNRLLTSAESIEEAFGQAAFTSIRLSAAWREANFVAGEFTGNTSNLNEALNLTTVGLEDAAVAFGSLVTSGAGLGTLVAPGVGLLFESVNNVVEAATDYVAISRLVSTLPTWFSQG